MNKLVRVLGDYWLVIWINNDSNGNQNNSFFLGIYILLFSLFVFLVLGR